MFKALILLGGPLMSAGLVFAFGLPVLIACAALALGTLLFSTGSPESAEPNDMGSTTFLAGL